ncbi:Phosphatidylinositol polyphosphate 5-phosphatase type IV [Trichinella spiralis]|uniref:Phosphatidylinositol polyphosphate 5-phosphatase type IV n=1 Tax=Trichinella spiralis TaxID=6334 RepID=A0ABR3KS29_TRISP
MHKDRVECLRLHSHSDGWKRANWIDEATVPTVCFTHPVKENKPTLELAKCYCRCSGQSVNTPNATAQLQEMSRLVRWNADRSEPAKASPAKPPNGYWRRHGKMARAIRQNPQAQYHGRCQSSILGCGFERTLPDRSNKQTAHSLTSPNLQLPKIYLSDVRENKRGSIVTATLLGPDELDRILPGRKLNLFVATFNMAGKNLTENELKDWLMPAAMEHAADLYAVGIQEASANCSSKEFRMWEKSLQKCLSTCKQVLVRSVWMGVQHLALFIRRELVWFISESNTYEKNTRPISNVRTKGAISIFMKLFGTTFLFISCHLSHGPDARPRISECNRILQFLRQNMASYSNENVFDGSDYVLWFGDMNFRLNVDPALFGALQSSPPTSKDLPQLIKRDQLLSAMKQGQLLSKFHECPIEFLPSYKFIIGTSDYSIQFRLPAYTDRILFKKKESDNNFMECLHYNTAYNICSSDHKPVFAHFKVYIQPEIQENRRSSIIMSTLHQIMEGNRRWKRHKVTSQLCSIM